MAQKVKVPKVVAFFLKYGGTDSIVSLIRAAYGDSFHVREQVTNVNVDSGLDGVWSQLLEVE